MTVSSSTNSASYSGNGSTTAFAYGFKIFEDSDLTVTLIDDTTEVETVQTLTTDYTVSGAGTNSGGNVTFVTAPASGKTVKIERSLAFTQTTAYTENDAFPAKAHEDGLDRLTMLTQQNKDKIDAKAPKASPTFTGTVTIPTAAVTTFSLGGTTVTATAAELNFVDGVTSNIQTQLDAKGTVSSLSDLSVTATAAELNIMDGVTATTAELNHVDGVTSAIQTQLDAKMPLAGGTFSGNVTYADNARIRIGAGNDLDIYHDGSNSYITEQGTGSLFIKSNGAGIVFRDAADANYISMLQSTGEAKLFHISGGSATQRLATSSVGIDVNGSTETDKLRITTSSAPSSASDTGTVGEIAWDTNYIYVCVGTDTWKRVAISTW